MKKLFLLALLLAFTSIGLGQGSGPITVKEVDGSPVCNNCRTFVFPNGSLTVSGNKVTVASGGGSSGITIGTTTANGTAGRVLYTDGSFVQAYTVTGSGNAVLSASPTFTGTVSAAAATLSGVLTSTLNGAVSAPAITATGTWFTGGSATTTKPYALIEPTGATSTGWSTSGTGLGVNAATGFAGNLFDFQLNGGSVFKATPTTMTATGLTINTTGGNVNLAGVLLASNSTGYVIANGTFGYQIGSSALTSPDITIRRVTTASLQLGATNSATPVANLLTIGESSRGGTDSNVAGANGTVQSGLGTGTGALSTLILRSPITAASGTTAQTYATGLTIIGGTAKKTSYTVATLPAAATVGAGATAFVTDALTPVFGSAVTGGGAVGVPVYSDGSTWLVG